MTGYDRLQELFLNRDVGLGHTQEFPPCSPDLTPCDFFLWDYLKQSPFHSSSQCSIPRTEDQAKDLVPPENSIYQNLVNAMCTRAERCYTQAGGHVEGRA